jgi:hypothetical protein
MLPRRRDRQTPDLLEEREIPRRRGRQMLDPAMEREMHDLRARLEEMETSQRCTVSAGDVSDSESEIEVEHEGEEVGAEDAAKKHLIRAIARMGARVKMDIPAYEGNLDAEELLDWIRASKTLNYSDEEITAGEDANKHEEILIHEDITHLFGFCYFCR